MLQDLVFCFNKVLPYFLLIAIGFVAGRKKLISKAYFDESSNFVYKFALPVLIFQNTSRVDWGVGGYGGLISFAFFGTLGSIAVIWIFFEIICRNQKHLIGTLVQGAYRGNYSVLGVALASSLIGESSAGIASLVSAFIVPVYNVVAVVVLQTRGRNSSGVDAKHVIREVLRNRLIWAILLGVSISLLPLQVPELLDTTLDMVGATAAPLVLMAVGSVLKWDSSPERLRPTILACLIKTVISPVFMTIFAYFLGFSGDYLFLIFVIFAVPSASLAYPMARAMGGDGPLAANILVVTTFVSAFVLAFGATLMRFLGWI